MLEWGALTASHGMVREFSLLGEWAVCAGVAYAVILAWRWRSVAYVRWAWLDGGRRRLGTAGLVFVQASVITIVSFIGPAVNSAFGVRAISDLGIILLTAESAAAGVGAYVALCRRVPDEDGYKAYLSRVGRAMHEALIERADDAVPALVEAALEDEESRRKFLRQLRRALGEDAGALVAFRNLARRLPSLPADEIDDAVTALSAVIIRERIPPHRLLRR